MRSRVPLEGEDRSRSVCPVLASVLSVVFFFFSSVSCPRSSGARFSQFLGPSQVTPSYSTRSIELSSLSFLNSLDRGISIERTRPTCCSCCLIPPDSLHLSESTAERAQSCPSTPRSLPILAARTPPLGFIQVLLRLRPIRPPRLLINLTLNQTLNQTLNLTLNLPLNPRGQLRPPPWLRRPVPTIRPTVVPTVPLTTSTTMTTTIRILRMEAIHSSAMIPRHCRVISPITGSNMVVATILTVTVPIGYVVCSWQAAMCAGASACQFSAPPFFFFALADIN